MATTDHPPEPDLSLKICSLAAILFCTVLCAFCTASILHEGDVQRFGGLLLMPGFLGLGLTQYAGTFRGKASSAETAARLYSFGGGFMIIAFVCLLLDVLRSGERPSWPVAALGGLFLLFSAWGRAGGRLNRRWAEQVRRFEEKSADGLVVGDEPARSGTIRPLLWIGALLVFAGATWSFYAWLGPRFGEHLPADRTPLAIPDEASDVCYWMYGGTTAFEFSISQEGFSQWAEEKIARRRDPFPGLEPIDAPLTVPRYTAWLSGAAGAKEAVIREGCHFGWREGDERVEYAYDSRGRRAYYHRTIR